LTVGLVVYGIGALTAAIAPRLGVLVLGYSILQGVGTALLIPPVYILTTLLFDNVTSRARAFGAISGMGGIGAAAGPLIGGLITSAISWRWAYVFQAVITGTIIILSRRIVDPVPADPTRRFDLVGALLSAAGLVSVVMGILATDDDLRVTVLLVAVGAVLLTWFFLHVRSLEKRGVEPLLSTALFRNPVANIGLVTQNVQWLLLMGTSFVVSGYLQVIRNYSAVQTGVIFTAATAGVLTSSLAAERFAKRRAQRTLIIGGFVVTLVGVAVLLSLVAGTPSAWAFAPGLLLIGLGLGVMLTPSVNVVQSSFPETLQGEISGLSRSVSNLGSTLGTAVAGTILVAAVTEGDRAYAMAMVAIGVAGLVGLGIAFLLPKTQPHADAPTAA
jgi:MFS family permease